MHGNLGRISVVIGGIGRDLTLISQRLLQKRVGEGRIMPLRPLPEDEQRLRRVNFLVIIGSGKGAVPGAGDIGCPWIIPFRQAQHTVSIPSIQHAEIIQPLLLPVRRAHGLGCLIPNRLLGKPHPVG